MKDFTPWVKFTIGDTVYEGKEAEEKMDESNKAIVERLLRDSSAFTCCGEVIQGKFEFMAAPLAGRGFIWHQCQTCKKARTNLDWMS